LAGESGQNLLTKADILQGKNQRKTVFLEQYDKDVIVRPLTDGELSVVFDMIGTVPVNEMGIPDLNRINISTNLKALRLVCAMGLVEPKLTENEISEMAFGVPEYLAKVVLEYSGLTDGASRQIEKFRQDK
jgi:hypothetical protein